MSNRIYSGSAIVNCRYKKLKVLVPIHNFIIQLFFKQMEILIPEAESVIFRRLFNLWVWSSICVKVDDTPMVVHPEKIDFRRFV